MDLFKKEKESESEEQPQRGHREAQRQDDRPVQRGQRPMGQPGKPEKKRNPLKGIGLAAVAVLVATFFLNRKERDRRYQPGGAKCPEDRHLLDA